MRQPPIASHVRCVGTWVGKVHRGTVPCGDLFQIFDEEFGIGVNSQGHSGDTVLAPGTYESVEVNALGNWTIKIRPR